MIINLAVLAVCASLISLIIKEDFETGALLVSVSVCILMFFKSSSIISGIGALFSKVKSVSGINGECLAIIIKILSVAYATNFGVDICAQSGSKAVASALETVGKLTMLYMAMPMILEIFQSIADMMG